jgi:undecaprenyl diphosphate synthase
MADPSTELAGLKRVPGVPPEHLPCHVAIIMDGNGRWATERGLSRAEGHKAGSETVKRITEEAIRLGIRQLTLYTFSAQNWGRPTREVRGLMRLLHGYLVHERDKLMEHGIRLVAIGRRNKIPRQVLRELEATESLTAPNQRFTLCLALNYGAREEIVDAVRAIAADAAAGRLAPGRVTEKTIDRYLYTAGMPDPDLLVRTAGEMRVSNFLLWQISYAEFYVTDACWPDFDEEHLHDALRAYARRRRTYGLIEEA